MSSNRILGLDGIRAYAALMVVVTHMYLFIELYNTKSPYYSLVRGIIGVQIFFVLSGLLITNLLYHEHKKYGRISLKYFMIRRGLRIFPAFYLFILAVIFVGMFFETVTTPKQLFYASIYWFNHVPRTEYNILLGHTWSLAVEEHFYLIWPPIFILMMKVKLSPNTKILIVAISIYSITSVVGLLPPPETARVGDEHPPRPCEVVSIGSPNLTAFPPDEIVTNSIFLWKFGDISPPPKIALVGDAVPYA